MVCLLEVHPRELEEYYSTSCQSSCSDRKTRTENAKPHFAFEYRIPHPCQPLDPTVPWIVCWWEAALRRGLERPAVRVGCDPARFGVLSIRGRVLGGPETGRGGHGTGGAASDGHQ